VQALAPRTTAPKAGRMAPDNVVGIVHRSDGEVAVVGSTSENRSGLRDSDNVITVLLR
jgi:hypothetical protein